MTQRRSNALRVVGGVLFFGAIVLGSQGLRLVYGGDGSIGWGLEALAAGVAVVASSLIYLADRRARDEP